MTHAHQLALSTIHFSPWQVLYWYDRPSQFRGEPELAYWRDLPTCWDETRVLKDKIGQCASVARRRASEWFIGTINPAGGARRLPSVIWHVVLAGANEIGEVESGEIRRIAGEEL